MQRSDDNEDSDMDDGLLKALNEMSDELGLARLEDVLAEPDRYTYESDLDSTD